MVKAWVICARSSGSEVVEGRRVAQHTASREELRTLVAPPALGTSLAAARLVG